MSKPGTFKQTKVAALWQNRTQGFDNDLVYMKYVIDRFEGETAVLEAVATRKSINRTRADLPPGIREGDVLICEGDVFFTDKKETELRAERIKARFERLKNCR